MKNLGLQPQRQTNLSKKSSKIDDLVNAHVKSLEEEMHDLGRWFRHRVPHMKGWSDEKIWLWNQRRIDALNAENKKIDQHYEVPPEGKDSQEYRSRTRHDAPCSYEQAVARIEAQTAKDRDLG